MKCSFRGVQSMGNCPSAGLRWLRLNQLVERVIRPRLRLKASAPVPITTLGVGAAACRHWLLLVASHCLTDLPPRALFFCFFFLFLWVFSQRNWKGAFVSPSPKAFLMLRKMGQNYSCNKWKGRALEGSPNPAYSSFSTHLLDDCAIPKTNILQKNTLERTIKSCSLSLSLLNSLLNPTCSPLWFCIILRHLLSLNVFFYTKHQSWTFTLDGSQLLFLHLSKYKSVVFILVLQSFVWSLAEILSWFQGLTATVGRYDRALGSEEPLWFPQTEIHFKITFLQMVQNWRFGKAHAGSQKSITGELTNQPESAGVTPHSLWPFGFLVARHENHRATSVYLGLYDWI